jgi:4-hydroxy-3-methylbut-2-enyl diphosphate reductase IspH
MVYSRVKNILDISKRIDFLIVIGDITSNNTATLYNLAKKQGTKTLIANSIKDILDYDFSNINVCAITSGTSTMKKDVEDIYKELNKRYFRI